MNLSLCAYGREASSAPVLCRLIPPPPCRRGWAICRIMSGTFASPALGRLVGGYGLSVVPALSDPFLGSLSAAVFLRFFLP